jgi:diguanylate cyclase (GGDEF)-like protein
MDTLFRSLPRILLVDDDPGNIQVLAAALGTEYQAHFTTRSDEALELARRLPLDLIVLDLVMPGQAHGLDVLHSLRNDPATAGIPVIIVSAMNELADEAAGLDAGAVDYITKPISPPIVRARVRTHVELKRQRDMLARLAEIDGLTGIANRRRFDNELALRWSAAQRGNRPLGLVLADVDHFKRYNDALGHGQGDTCLRAVASALTSAAARDDDLVARWGGEEFAILCRGEGTLALMQRILQAVHALALPHPGTHEGGRVSLSLGAVALVPDDDRPELALARADGLLYRAKREGRGRGLLADNAHDAVITVGIRRPDDED